MRVYQLWLIFSVFMFIIEVFTPGFVAACVGIGAVFAALTAVLDLDLAWQITGFMTGLLLAFLVVRPLALKYLYKPVKHTATNVEALIGKQGIVIQPITLNGTGRVKVGGDDWMAVSNDEMDIPANTVVDVLAVEGAKVIVKKIDKEGGAG